MHRHRTYARLCGKWLPCTLMAWLIGLSLPDFACSSEAEPNSYVNSIGMKMLYIPAGTFRMGTEQPRIDGWDEEPVHKVTISQPFYISEQEVTIEQFQFFRGGFSGSRTAEPYITGISWYDAMDFCEWLSEKEDKPYRLPTEAEWEYAARAGTSAPYWSGDEPPESGTANPWGLRNVHWRASEWCYDWYGPYAADDQKDPVGAADGMAKLIRGGGLDEMDAYYARCANRASYAPAFAEPPVTEPDIPTDQLLAEARQNGLVGLLYGNETMDRVDGMEVITTLNDSWGRSRGNDWAAQWSGVLLAPATGEITFHVAADYGVLLEIDGKKVIDWTGSERRQSAGINLEKGKKYPLQVTYFHYGGGKSYLSVEWSWAGQPRTPLPEANLLHSPQQKQGVKQIADRVIVAQPAIGFRVVQAPLPKTKPRPAQKPFVQQCVVQNRPMVKQGPCLDRPWFRRRPLLPIPPDNVPREHSRRAGLHPAMMNHNHSPALEVCPNGDLLAVLFTSEREYEPEVSLMATRLRFGADQWDMPEIFCDFRGVCDISPLLYTEKGTMYLFWGHPRFDAAFPFQWMTSSDSGATWSEVHFPRFVAGIGPHSRQPINTVVRGQDGTLYVASDGEGGTSVLWATKDNGNTWYDTGGRSGGRHTTYALLKDGRILGMGGKNTNIDGYMPKSISSDVGRTWEVSKTPFAALGSNQRPCLIRLQSGRLFLCGDFQHRQGHQPDGIEYLGSYAALSEDEGENWLIKKLVGTLPHELDHLHDTLGYSVARQAPNGIIHLITTMNTPCLHFELNEAWILNERAGFDAYSQVELSDVSKLDERHPSGRTKAKWSGGVSPDGAYLLHGRQIWYYENGQQQWEVRYKAGRKVGYEAYWNEDGSVAWQWQHHLDGTSIWTQYRPTGDKKSESVWRNFRMDGVARRWNCAGEPIGEARFVDGRIQ